jgi:hypothetical protein
MSNYPQTKTPLLRFREFSGGWKSKKLEDITDVKGGKRISKGDFLQSEKSDFPYIRVSERTVIGSRRTT